MLLIPAPTRPVLAALLLPLTLLAAPAADAATRELLTVPISGTVISGPATLPAQQAVSSDGSRVIFSSSALNLDAADAGKVADVFVRDRGAAETIRVTATAAGNEPNGASGAPALSGDGRYAVFLTKATNLGVATGSALAFDLVRRDLAKGPGGAGAFELVALDVATSLGATAPSISADGDRIAYATTERDAATDTDSADDVFVRAMAAGTTEQASVGSAEPATWPSLSADGSRVAFRTESQLDPADHDSQPDAYVRDLGTNTTLFGSKGQGATHELGTQLSLDGTGRHLAFSTTAPLAAEDTNAAADVYLRDLATGEAARVSVGAGNRQTAGLADRPVVSGDASVVAFQSAADDLVPERGPAALRNRTTARTTAPEESDGAPSVSGDGQVLVYPRSIDGASASSGYFNLYADDLEPSSDSTPPTLVVPGDLNLSATFAGGRYVRFADKVTDVGSGPAGSICTPASGSRFKVGTTTVSCLAADRAGNETAKSFTVTVVDRQAPRLTVPDTVDLTTAAGKDTPLDTLVRAVDNVEGTKLTPTCTPPAGTFVGAGTTTVNCQVTDAAGNSGEGCFTVKVTGAASVPAATASSVVTNEHATGVAVQLTLAEAPKTDLTVPVTVTDGTAILGEDYSVPDDKVVVKAGARYASVFLKLQDDLRPEDPETFTVQFDGAGARPAAVGTVTVKDDDGPREDRRRQDVGPMVWVDDRGHRLMALDGDSTDPRVVAYHRDSIIVDPQVSPDGTELLYTADRQVYRRPLDGGKAEPVDRAYDMGADHPTWRPDGEAFVYLAHEGPATWLHYETLDGGREDFSYGVPNATGDPVSWDPAGERLLFIESNARRDGEWQLGDLAILDAETGKVVRRWVTPELDRNAEWSPDGKSIVFLRSKRTGTFNTFEGETVSVLDIATGKITDLTPPADLASKSSYGPPTWSADGKTIAFVDRDERRGTGDPYRIATVAAAGGPVSTRIDFADPAEQYLNPDQGYLDWAGLAAGGPTDEGRIVFARRTADGSGSRLLSVKADGDDERVVAQLGAVSAAPAVAADGTWLTWASTRDRATGEIYVSTPGGRAIQRITTNTETDSEPAISADGQLIAYVRGTGKAREIWVYDRLEGQEERLVAAGADGVGEPAFVNGADAIAYVKSGDVPEIRQINLTGSGDRRLTDGTAPAFDRRGTRLAFQRQVGTDPAQVYVAQADGSEAEKLTEEPGGAAHPAWGPDNRSVAYASRLGIAVTTTDGGQAFLLTTEGADGEPTWARVAALPKLRIDDAAITEGTGGVSPVGLTLTIDRPVDDPVTASLTTADGSAKAPRDYTAKGPVTVTIPAGDVTATEAVDVQADSMDEPEESFTVSLSAASGAAIDDGEATVSIRDDDDPPTLSVADVRMPEGDLGDTDAVFTLKLSAESGWTVTATATTAHGTTDDDDLRARTTPVTWEPGALEQTVRVPVIGDTQNEPDETFTLGITAQSHVTGPPAPATATLVNDDVVGKLPDTGITHGPGQLITTPAPMFEFIGSVPRGLFECRVDALPWTPCTTPHRIRAVADGAHTFQVRALDGALIDPTPAEYGFTVDTVAPSTTITKGPARISNVKAPAIALATDDKTAGFQCRLDDAAWGPCAAQSTLPVLADGDHAFAARAVDPAGNVDPTPAAIAFRVDSRAPQTSWADKSVPQGDTTPTSTSASVGLSAGAQPKLAMDSSGVVAVPVTCASASTTSCSGQVVVEELPGGKKTANTATPAAAGPAVLAKASYSVAPGVTEPVAIRLGDAARFKVERKGRVNARVLVSSTSGTAAPVPLILLPDAGAPRLLDAGTTQRPGGGDRRGLTIRIACPKPLPVAKNASKAAKRAAQTAAKAACTGTAEVRVDGTTSVSRAKFRGTPGRTVRLKLRLTNPAAARVAATKTTAASLRLTWGTAPATAAKTVDLTLTRGASR